MSDAISNVTGPSSTVDTATRPADEGYTPAASATLPSSAARTEAQHYVVQQEAPGEPTPTLKSERIG